MSQCEFPSTGQRLTISTHEEDIHNQENPAIPASAEDIARDTLGFTNPNLHRRIRVNVFQDGQKVYTILEPFVAKSSDATYNTKYPIDTITFVSISGNRVQSIQDSIDLVRDTQSNIAIGFKFNSGYAPQEGSTIEVVYETIPLIDEEVSYRDYGLAISGVYSYRTTKITLHTEEDEGDREHRVYENEIP